MGFSASRKRSWAAISVAETFGRDAMLLVLAADHLILDEKAFGRAVAQAMTLAEQDWLVTFGIIPTAPETGYGYIEAGEPIADATGESGAGRQVANRPRAK